MPDDENDEIGGGIVGPVMVKRLAASRAVLGDLEECAKHPAAAAMGAEADKAAPHRPPQRTLRRLRGRIGGRNLAPAHRPRFRFRRPAGASRGAFFPRTSRSGRRARTVSPDRGGALRAAPPCSDSISKRSAPAT